MSKIKNNGGAAFPRPSVNYGERCLEASNEGMTLRAYFAAHAPAEPQNWFSPTPMPTKKPLPQYVADEGGRHYTDAIAAEKECGDCFHIENQAKIDAWDAELLKRRLIEWPWAWADAMIEQEQR